MIMERFTKYQVDEIAHLIGKGLKIEAIKAVRQFTGCHLKEAKIYIDQYLRYAEIGEPAEEAMQRLIKDMDNFKAAIPPGLQRDPAKVETSKKADKILLRRKVEQAVEMLGAAEVLEIVAKAIR